MVTFRIMLSLADEHLHGGVCIFDFFIMRGVTSSASFTTWLPVTAALGYLLVNGTTCSCGPISPVDLSNK